MTRRIAFCCVILVVLAAAYVYFGLLGIAVAVVCGLTTVAAIALVGPYVGPPPDDDRPV